MDFDAALSLLLDYVTAIGGQSKAARLLNCSRSTLCRVLKGNRNVGIRLAYDIQNVVGIPHDSWFVSTTA